MKWKRVQRDGGLRDQRSAGGGSGGGLGGLPMGKMGIPAILVIVAVVQPRLGPLWFIGLPLNYFVTTGTSNGSTQQTVAVLVAAALTIVLALRPVSFGKRTAAVSSPAAARP